MDLLRLNTLRGTLQGAFLTPERYEERLHPFYVGVPPPPLGWISPLLLSLFFSCILLYKFTIDLVLESDLPCDVSFVNGNFSFKGRGYVCH